MITCARRPAGASVSATPCAVVPPMPGVDLVEDHRLAAADGRDRERDPGELAAGGRLGDRRERQARVRPDQECDLVRAGRARLALAELRRGTRRPPCRCRAARQRRPPQTARPPSCALPERGRDLAPCAPPPLRPPPRAASAGSSPWSTPSSSARASAARASSSSVRLAPEAAPCVREPVELRFDLLEPAGVGLQHREERPQRARRLAQPELCVPKLVGGLLQLRRERAPPARAHARPPRCAPRPLPPPRDRAPRPRPRLPRRARSGGAAARAPPAALPPGPPASPRCPRPARAAPPAAPRPSSVPRQLLVPPARAPQLAPRGAAPPPGAELLLAAERVEHGQLVGRPREPALLELAGHREQPLAEGGDVLARCAPAPCIRPRAPLRPDPAREHHALLVVRPQLGEALERLLVEQARGQLELCLDVRLGRARPDVRRVALRAEQEPDRLRENRLPGARLARDRVQARREAELRFADQDEVLDPEPT